MPFDELEQAKKQSAAYRELVEKRDALSAVSLVYQNRTLLKRLAALEPNHPLLRPEHYNETSERFANAGKTNAERKQASSEYVPPDFNTKKMAVAERILMKLQDIFTPEKHAELIALLKKSCISVKDIDEARIRLNKSNPEALVTAKSIMLHNDQISEYPTPHYSGYYLGSIENFEPKAMKRLFFEYLKRTNQTIMDFDQERIHCVIDSPIPGLLEYAESIKASNMSRWCKDDPYQTNAETTFLTCSAQLYGSAAKWLRDEEKKEKAAQRVDSTQKSSDHGFNYQSIMRMTKG